MRWVVVLLLSGCSSILGIDDFKLGDAASGDGDASETGFCLGSPGWRVCTATEPTETKTFDSTNLDTSGNPNCGPQPKVWKDAGHPDACFFFLKSATFGNGVTFRGDRPLVVFAADSITVSGQIDVASHYSSTATLLGAGAKSQASCLPPMAAGGSTGGGGGGAGGSFMRKGGNGGASSSQAGTRGQSSAADSQAPTLLRGGCDGGVGGGGSAAGGVAGAGGGAIYLVAKNRITINGFINASGAAGGPSFGTGGGGGGGSGGMIVLHAPVIDGNGGVLIANGAGAGGGGTGSSSGQPGAEPSPTNPAITAQGGLGSGRGGNGFAGTTEATDGTNGSPTTAAGGGGGGGGAGYIRVNVAPSQVTSSPAVSRVPD